VGKEVKGLWLKDLELGCRGYLAFRHLHDAAYFAPIRDDNPDHKHSTEFSIRLFKKNFATLVAELQSQRNKSFDSKSSNNYKIKAP